MSRRFWIVVALALAASLGALVWQLTGDRRVRGSDRIAAPGGVRSPAGSDQAPGAVEQSSRQAVGEAAGGAGGLDPEGVARGAGDEAFAQGQTSTEALPAVTGSADEDRKYPPSSRPLAGAEPQHLFPLAGMQDSKPLVADNGEGEGERDRALHYVFKADRNAVVGDEPLTLTLAVYDGPPESGAKRVPARILEADVRDTGPVVAVGIELGKLSFNDEGREGDAVARDLVQTCHFVPAAHGLYPDGGFYFAQVAFAVQGHPRTEAKVAFLHTAEERIPARFTGEFADRVEDGSLMVSVGLEIVQAGQFLIAANLYDQSGAPLARASNLLALEQGKRSVDLTFYGLILREANVSGPYVVRYVRGHRTLSGQFPNREEIPKFEGEHRTAAYEVGEFSDARWEDR